MPLHVLRRSRTLGNLLDEHERDFELSVKFPGTLLETWLRWVAHSNKSQPACDVLACIGDSDEKVAFLQVLVS